MFWDLVGSTRAWEEQPGLMRNEVHAWEHSAKDVIGAHSGDLFKLTGDGGCAAFESASNALESAIELQRAHVGSSTPARVALLSGEAEHTDADWFGTPLNRCARLMGLGHGGQILVAGSTALLLETGDWALRDLGVHRLRDVPDPVVVHQVLADGLDSEFPPLRSEVRFVSLPTSRDRLVGREMDIGLIADEVGGRRLITLTGVGGTGKTRLAVEVARTCSPEFEMTAFVDLAVVGQESQVPRAAMTALDLVAPGLEPTAALVAAFIDHRAALLVIDNAEHVLDATADLVETVLDACPDARILVTSREPLGVRGEHVMGVRSLDPQTTAVELFCDRVGRPVDLAVTAELCARLDGIPLAIELAAARARSLGVEEVLTNVADRFKLLVGSRRASGRQATLHATLLWSHDLLQPDEQTLLRRLAVFAGGFTPATVEIVCGTGARLVLSSLVDKSLVVFDDETHRHRLLETVRLFALERLDDAGEAAEIRDRHARWLIEALHALPSGSYTDTIFFTPEAANVRAAADWLCAEGRGREALLLLADSGGMWAGLRMDREVGPVIVDLYGQCEDELSTCERVSICTLLEVLLTESTPLDWAHRAVAADPDHVCAATDAARIFLLAGRAYTDPAGALEVLVQLGELRLDPEFALFRHMIEANARFVLGDFDGAEQRDREGTPNGHLVVVGRCSVGRSNIANHARRRRRRRRARRVRPVLGVRGGGSPRAARPRRCRGHHVGKQG